MNATGHDESAAARRCRLAVIVVVAAVYFLLPMVRNVSVPTHHWFAELADAFLRGRMSIEPPPGVSPFELIPIKGSDRFHVAYPPLPALVLLPFVAVLGKAGTAVAVCRALCVVAVILFDAILGRAWPRLFGRSLPPADHLLLVAGFALGTALWDTAARAGDWHLAHACAVVFLMAAVVEFFGRRRWWLIGALWGAAMLARPTVALAGLFFLFMVWRERDFRRVTQLIAGPVGAVLLLAAYNTARFGTAFDFHYDEMLFVGEPAMLMKQYGQFNAVFVPRNLFWFFLAPPALSKTGGFPWIVYCPFGLSLFLTSPFVAYGIVGAVRGDPGRNARAATVATVLCLCVLLAYFNTGFWQFGHRFGLDYLPIWFIAVMVGLGARPSRLARGLIVASMAIHIWGIAICGMDRVAVLPEWLTPGV